MGFFKKLGRLAKQGVKLAASAGLVPGAGAVAGVLASRLQTAGENRRKLALARKGALVKKPSSYLQTATGKPDRAPAWRKAQAPQAAKQIRLTGQAAALAASSVSAKREARRKASTERLARFRELDARIKKLTPSEKADLAERFQREGGGSPAEFRAFLLQNA